MPDLICFNSIPMFYLGNLKIFGSLQQILVNLNFIHKFDVYLNGSYCFRTTVNILLYRD